MPVHILGMGFVYYAIRACKVLISGRLFSSLKSVGLWSDATLLIQHGVEGHYSKCRCAMTWLEVGSSTKPSFARPVERSAQLVSNSSAYRLFCGWCERFFQRSDLVRVCGLEVSSWCFSLVCILKIP